MTAAWVRGAYDGNSEAIKASWACGDHDGHTEAMKAAHARGTHDGIHDNPETRRKHAMAAKASWARGDHDGLAEAVRVAHVRGAYDGVYDDPEYRCKKSDAAKAAWARGAYDGIFGPPYKSTEVPLIAALDICGIEHMSQYRPDGCRFTYDEFVPPNILIEAHGDYWHGPQKPKKQKRDAEKAAWAKESGYLLIIMWEHEIQEQGAWPLIHERILPLL